MSNLIVYQNYELAVNKTVIGKLPNTTSTQILIYNKQITDRKLKDVTDDDLEECDEIFKAILEWAYALGIELMDEEAITISKFIRDGFPTLNVFDLRVCVKLVAVDSPLLVSDAKYSEKMSLIYIAKTLNAYKKYKGISVCDVREEIGKSQRRLGLPISDNDRVASFIRLLKEEKAKVDEKKEDVNVGGVLFGFIKHNKLIQFDEKLIKDALDFGNRHFKLDIKDINKGKLFRLVKESDFTPQEKQNMIEYHARRFTVITWLKSLSLEKFLQKITNEMILY